MGTSETFGLTRGRGACGALAALLVVVGLALALSATFAAAWAAGGGAITPQTADNVVTVESEPATTLEVGSKYVFVSTYNGTSYAMTNEAVSNGLVGATVTLGAGSNGQSVLTFTSAENAANSQWEAVSLYGSVGLDCDGKHLTVKFGTLTSDASQQSTIAYDGDWSVFGNCLGLVTGESYFDAWDGNVTPAVAYKVVAGGDPQPSSFFIAKADAQNGSFAVQVGGSDVASADADATVSVVPAPDDNYETASISVTKASDGSPVELNGAAFTMPSEAVTVSVTFRQIEATTANVRISKKPVTALVPGKRYVFISKKDAAKYAMKGAKASADDNFLMPAAVASTTNDGKNYASFSDADNAALSIWTASSSSNGVKLKNGANYISNNYLAFKLGESEGCSFFNTENGWEFGYSDGCVVSLVGASQGFAGRSDKNAYPPAAAYEVLAADDVEVSTAFGITKADATGGSFDVLVDGEAATEADKDAVVTVAPVPDDGYVVDSVSVKKSSDGSAVEMDGSTFTMPGEAVTVSVMFKNLGAVEGTIAVSDDPVTTLVPGKRYVFLANYDGAMYAMKGKYSNYMGYEVVEAESKDGKKVVDFADADAAALSIWTAGASANGTTVKNGASFLSASGSYLNLSATSGSPLAYKDTYWDFGYSSSGYGIGIYGYKGYAGTTVYGFTGRNASYYPDDMAAAYEVLATNGLNTTPFNIGVGEGVTENAGIYSTTGGTFTIKVNGSDAKTAMKKQTVTVSTTPDAADHYVLGGITVEGAKVTMNGNDATFPMPGADVVVNVAFKQRYAVTFDVNGATNVSGATKQVDKGGTVAWTGSRPAVDGKVFVGWAKQGETGLYDFNTPVAEDFTLVAQFKDLVYDIASADDWNTFKGAVEGGIDYAGKTVTLSADIAVSEGIVDDGSYYSPKVFAGSFDGQGHTITLAVNSTKTSGSVGLFGVLKPGYGVTQTIKDLKFAGSVSSASMSGGVAALIGAISGSGTVVVKQVGNNAAITGPSGEQSSAYAGGFVGKSDGATLQLVNCFNRGTVNGSGACQVGGLVGGTSDENAVLSIAGCYNTGDVVIANDGENRSVGGFLGNVFTYYSYGMATVNISDSYNACNVGIAGGSVAAASSAHYGQFIGKNASSALGEKTNLFFDGGKVGADKATGYGDAITATRVSADVLKALAADGDAKALAELKVASGSDEVSLFKVNADGYPALYWESVTPPAPMRTVKFVDADGTEISSSEYAEGTAAADVAKPADPTKADGEDGTSYEFAGWDPEVADVVADAIYTAAYREIAPVTVVTESGDAKAYSRTQLKAMAAAKNGGAATKMQSVKKAGQVQAAAADGYVKVVDLLADAGATWQSGYELEIWTGDELYAPGGKWADTTFDAIDKMKWFYPNATSLDAKATDGAEEVPFALSWAVRSANYEGEGQTAADALEAALQADPDTSQVRTLVGAWADGSGEIQAPGWRSAKGVTKIVVKKTPAPVPETVAVEVKAVDAKGAVIPGAKIEVVEKDDASKVVAAESNGKYTLTVGVEYTVKAMADGYEDGSMDVLAAAGMDDVSMSLAVSSPIDPPADYVPVSVEKVDFSVADQVWTGRPITPVAKSVVCGGKTLKEGVDYLVTYADNEEVGVATAWVTAKSDLIYGSKPITFKIAPKGTQIKSLKAGKGKLTVKWAKQLNETDGYEIAYSTKANFSKAKTLKVKNPKKASAVIKKLKAKKTYYVRIRTYMQVDKQVFASEWSPAKSLTVKKKVKKAAAARSVEKNGYTAASFAF